MLNDCTVLIQMQVQYEDSLIVEYDTPHTFFRVPALTLQPIVENSVKHGRGGDPDDNSDPGIALGNIRQRLEMMCGGMLTIKSNEGGGTVVTVTIPDSLFS